MRELIKRVVRACGYEIHKAPKVVRGFRAEYLRRFARPATVIDVGVGWGTDELYEAFPDAHLVLVEPVAEYRSALDRIASRYRTTIIPKAVGEKPGRLALHVDTVDPHKSSFMDRTDLTRTRNPLDHRSVEVTTLDAIRAEHPELETPIFLKIDTEGYELEVIRGATALLAETELVLAEVSVARRFEGSYAFEELIAALRERGFRPLDFLATHPIRGGLGTKTVDLVFSRDGAARAT